jgi:hypothetical protein
MYGAAPHIPDKRGVTPLDLLPVSNPDPTSTFTSDSGAALRTVIREYYESEKAKEKESYKSQSQMRFHGKAAAVLGFPREDDGKRVGVKRSVENLLSKSPKHVPIPLTPSPGRKGVNGIGTPPPSPRRPSASASERVPPSPTSPFHYTFGSATPTSSSFASTPTPTTGSTFSSGTPASFTPPIPDQRRPSLPHVFDEPLPSPSPIVRPPSTGARPRSAGSGSQPPAFGSQGSSNAPAFSSSGHARPRTKRSLLSLFKKSDGAQDSYHSDKRDKEAAMERERDRAGSYSFSAAVGANWATSMAATTTTPSRSTSDFDEKAAMLHNEVHTAPPERTTFHASSARFPEDVFCDEEEDDYGVPLVVREPEPLPLELIASPPDSDDGNSGDEEDEDETVEDGACDPDLELERTGTSSTGETMRPGRLPRPSGEGRFVPPKHAEGWYRDRMDSAQGSGSSLGLPPTPQDNGDATPPPTSPRTRPGILRGDHSVRRTGSRGALRFEADRQESQEGRALREKGSRSSLLSVGSRSLLSAGSGSGDGSRDRDRLIADNRIRGDSVSSASTDASAPPRSQISQETSTGTMTSSSTMNSTSSAPVPSLDGGRLRDGYADALLDSSEDDDRGPALGLNIRTVSSHAQAEALVQKAAKEILELNAAADAEAGPSLSAQLAAYGETLQLERRFARGEAQRFKSPTKPLFDNGPRTDEQEEERRREEDRRQKAQEKMVRSQEMMDRYAREREGGKERKSPEVLHRDREGRKVGCPLARTTSLEKEMGTGDVEKPAKSSKSPRMRRPHTSDSVRSAGEYIH